MCVVQLADVFPTAHSHTHRHTQSYTLCSLGRAGTTVMFYSLTGDRNLLLGYSAKFIWMDEFIAALAVCTCMGVFLWILMPPKRLFTLSKTKTKKTHKITSLCFLNQYLQKQWQTMTRHPGAGLKRLQLDSQPGRSLWRATAPCHMKVLGKAREVERWLILDSHISPHTSLVITLDVAWHLQHSPTWPQLVRLRQHYKTQQIISSFATEMFNCNRKHIFLHVGNGAYLYQIDITNL